MCQEQRNEEDSICGKEREAVGKETRKKKRPWGRRRGRKRDHGKRNYGHLVIFFVYKEKTMFC
jgi:hypothetical protein